MTQTKPSNVEYTAKHGDTVFYTGGNLMDAILAWNKKNYELAKIDDRIAPVTSIIYTWFDSAGEAYRLGTVAAIYENGQSYINPRIVLVA